MRPKERIPRILEKLEEYWKDNQDLRLGQILSNASYIKNHTNDPFYLVDREFEEYLDSQLD